VTIEAAGLADKEHHMETKTNEENKKPEAKPFWGRTVKSAPASKSAAKKRARRARYSRVHVITGKAGDIVTIGGTRYKIAPAGNLVKVQ